MSKTAFVAAAPDSDTSESVCIMALPAADDPVQEIGPEEKHATVLYFGDISEHADPERMESSRSLLLDVVSIAAREQGPFDANVIGIEPLGDEEPPAQVWLLDSPELQRMFDSLQDIDSEVHSLYEDAEATRYPSYKPHVTIGYGGPEVGSDDARENGQVSDDQLDEATRIESIRFDRLSLWWGDERFNIPLGVSVTAATRERFVETPEGARYFGVPIGTKIVVDDEGKPVKGKARIPGAEQQRQSQAPDKPTKFVPTVPGQKAKLPLQIQQRGRRSTSRTPQRSRVHLGQSVRETLSHVRRLDELVALGDRQRLLLERVQGGDRLSPAQVRALERLLEQAIRRLKRRIGSDESSEGEDEESKKAKKEPKAKSATKGKKGDTEESKITSPEDWLEDLQSALEAIRNLSDNDNRRRIGEPIRSTQRREPREQLRRQNFQAMNDEELTSAIRSLVRRRTIAEERGSPRWMINSELEKARTERQRRRDSTRRRDRIRRRRERARQTKKGETGE